MLLCTTSGLTKLSHCIPSTQPHPDLTGKQDGAIGAILELRELRLLRLKSLSPLY